MDDDSCSKFIGSLTKYLQSLCHSYVDFNTGVELAGHIYLNVDTGKKIDYVLNESVCKNGANVVKFTSNSYHAQPVEKKDKKDTPSKKDSKSDSGKRDDDDVIIVGSEGSRRNRTPGSSPRGHMSPQMQRGMGMNRMGQGMFRSPRGMSPRFGGPVPRAGGYTYQPRQRLTYTQQPRNYLAGYSPRMRQPYQPRASQMPVRPPNTGSAVDTDVAYMREEYVAGQTPTTTANQTGFQGQYTGGQQQPGTQGQAGQQFGAATAPGQAPNMAAGQPGNAASSGQEGVLPTTPSTDTNLFQQSAPSMSGGMPLPVTTHTIFDSGPVMAPMDLPTTQPIGDGASTSAASDPLAAAMSSAGVTTDSSVPVSTSTGGDSQNLLIGKVWSDTNHDPITQTAPAQASSTGAPGETNPTLSTDYMGQSGSGFDLFNQSVTQTSGASQTSQALPSTSSSLNPASSSEGDGFSALVSELQAFNQQAGAPSLSSQSHPTTTPTTTNTYPNTSTTTNAADRPSYGVSKTGERVLIKRDPGVKRDPDISANIASSVLQEEAANQSDRFSTPGSGGMDSYRKRGESAPSQASTSPGSAGLVGPESVVIETKPFLRHATDFDSGCDPASTASGNQGQQSHGPSTPQTPRLDSTTTTTSTPSTTSTPTLPVVNVKKERKDEDEVAEDPVNTVKHAQAEWQNKGKESDWVTDMSALNNSDSMESDSDTAQDDDDPNYTPGRPIEGSRKRTPRKAPSSQKGPPKSPAATSAASPETQKQQATPQKPPQAPVVEDNVVNILDSDEEEQCGTKSLPLPPNIVIKQEKPDEVVVKKEPLDEDEQQAMLPMIPRKSSAKRPLPKPADKGFKGKRRKTNPDSDGEEDHPHLPGDMGGDEDSGPPLPVLPPSLDSDQHMGGSYEETYKPGTFVLVNMSKDSDRPSRMRSTHNTPAEVIVPPLGQDGVWVHILVSAGGGLWRLPNPDQLVDVRLETQDIVKPLEKSHVNIVGSKVFYKFDDM